MDCVYSIRNKPYFWIIRFLKTQKYQTLTDCFTFLTSSSKFNDVKSYIFICTFPREQRSFARNAMSTWKYSCKHKPYVLLLLFPCVVYGALDNHKQFMF